MRLDLIKVPNNLISLRKLSKFSVILLSTLNIVCAIHYFSVAYFVSNYSQIFYLCFLLLPGSLFFITQLFISSSPLHNKIKSLAYRY